MNRYGAVREPFVFLIDFEMARPMVLKVPEAEGHGLFFSFPGISNFAGQKTPIHRAEFHKIPMDFDVYREAFRIVSKHLHHGDSYLVNLTFPTPVTTGLTFHEIMKWCPAKYKLMLEDEFVVFSPETFIAIRNGIISSFPMKGTIDASVADAERLILSDPKETAEHHTIVDLIRNDLSMVAKKVRVKRFRYVERIATNFKELMQVSSEIAGELPAGFHEQIGDILFALLPAGSVSGAPKQRTVEIIRETESGPRGYYTGVGGYFDGQGLDSAVLIRYIEKTPGGMQFRSGGGITVLSEVHSEYREMIDKVYVPAF
jgi:para-aminobenzoate synthetase component 1